MQVGKKREVCYDRATQENEEDRYNNRVSNDSFFDIWIVCI